MGNEVIDEAQFRRPAPTTEQSRLDVLDRARPAWRTIVETMTLSDGRGVAAPPRAHEELALRISSQREAFTKELTKLMR
ncbi:hypothetical protein [Azorhizobium caulinodans]|uniref:hypothetical protein n=1 Tax=Azorhizobium caulinodans TaxID=7 RepID=UPI002FBE6800